ncbi:hypothetical protein DPMN_056454 [Dreissena polymorpha]|uniref:Putative nuclease HARBI1 n=1 Tax=Dreissena polymorpha TaxID=45954 RepID=A0A9D4HTI1_DREPO|nr:hypothetical protein DPMN_056454 [Dreissena polymorpha]
MIFIGLRYLATGDFYSEVGDLHGVSKSTVSRVLGSFLDVLNEQLDNIKFPMSPEERQAIKLEFYQKSRIPGVIGAIDGTLVPIIGPHENEEVFRSRKGFHALNVQAVVDTKTIFRDVVSRWPGSVHDSAIFNNCGLKQYLETQQVGCLLGDSGYGLKTFLLTPKLNPITQQEVRYNAAHRRGRVVVERAFGMLKSRFRCLHKSGGCLPFQPQRAAKVVVACMRLHNLCVQFNVAVPQMNDTENDEIDDNIVGDGIDVNAQQARQLIIDRF